MDQTDRHNLRGVQDTEQGPFRKYGWVLAVLAVVLVVLCAGTGVVAASSAGWSFLDRLRGGAEGPAPTLIPARSDLPSPTASEPPSPMLTSTSESPAGTLPPSETPTSTATATRPAARAITCQCKGRDYVCSDGSAIYNSPRCAPAETPTCGCQKHDWVCSDGSRSVNDLRCGTVCVCQGNDLVCNDGTVGIYNPQCACTCDGTTLVCNDGGRQENAPYCKKKK